MTPWSCYVNWFYRRDVTSSWVATGVARVLQSTSAAMGKEGKSSRVHMYSFTIGPFPGGKVFSDMSPFGSGGGRCSHILSVMSCVL